MSSNNENSINSLSCNDLFYVKKNQLLYTKPPYRKEILSYYPTYTQYELDMRRKAEILKYSANNQNSKKNNFTKSQIWSQLSQNLNYKNKVTCNKNGIATPSYYSDVPGPPINLILDETIPLYNYKTNVDSYGIENIEILNKWEVFTENNVFFQNNTDTKLFSLFILKNIDKTFYNFQYKTAYVIYVNGFNNSGKNYTNIVNNIFTLNDLSLNITNITPTLFYNFNKVNNNTTISPSMSSVDYSISYDIRYNSSYQMYYYLGYLTVNIENLQTQPGYIYDFYLNFNMNLNSNNSENYKTIFDYNKLGVYCNVDDNLSIKNINTVVTNPLNSFTFYGYELSGT
jgi:hypothetical protein